MAELARSFDWKSTPLGPMEKWPQSLRIAVSICLNSRFPMFVWWGPDLINIYNDAYAPMLGQRHPAAFGRPAQPTWHEIWPIVGPQAHAVMTRAEATWNQRVLLVMERNGFVEDTWFTWSYSPIPDESGAVGGVYCACVEDTAHVLAERSLDKLAAELAEARDAAQTANQAKDRFLAVLSHELRTPLSPVVMTLASMEMDPDLHPRFREDLAMTRRNIDLEVKLIDDLLDLNRVTSGKLRLNTESVRVHDVLGYAIHNSLSDTSGKRLNIRRQFEAAHDHVIADAGRLQQIFWNLLRNAVKFTPQGGDITLRTWNTPNARELHIEIQDSGIGIEPQVLPRIFNAFEQGEIGVTRQFGGLGLGLAIAKAVVEMHGGTIAAASKGAGHGATFTVSLTTSDLPAESSQSTPSTRSSPPAIDGKSRVLLVEDHDDTARVLAKLLTISGFSVRIANCATSALQFASDEPFDIVVSDIGLPDATGYELMQQLNTRHGMKGIALSGFGMEEDVRKGREAGFVEHVVKPVNVSQLSAIIRRITHAANSQP